MGRQDQSSLSLSTVPNEMLGGGGVHRDGPTGQKEWTGQCQLEGAACPLCSLRVTTQMPIWVANVRPNVMKRPVYMDFHFLLWSIDLANPIFLFLPLTHLSPCSYSMFLWDRGALMG